MVRPKDEGARWLMLCVMAFLIFLAMFVFLAVIPSWWLYFADGVLKWTKPYLVDTTGGQWKFQLASRQTRDVIVTLYYGAVLVAGGLAIRAYNQRNPKLLPQGEDKREATGGYK